MLINKSMNDPNQIIYEGKKWNLNNSEKLASKAMITSLHHAFHLFYPWNIMEIPNWSLEKINFN